MRDLLLGLIRGWDEPVPFASIVHEVHWSCVASNEPEPSEAEIHQTLKDLRREGLVALGDGPRWSAVYPARVETREPQGVLFT